MQAIVTEFENATEFWLEEMFNAVCDLWSRNEISDEECSRMTRMCGDNAYTVLTTYRDTIHEEIFFAELYSENCEDLYMKLGEIQFMMKDLAEEIRDGQFD